MASTPTDNQEDIWKEVVVGAGGGVDGAWHNVEKMSFGQHVEMTNCDTKGYWFCDPQINLYFLISALSMGYVLSEIHSVLLTQVI